MTIAIDRRDALPEDNPFYVRHFIGETIIFVVTTLCILAKCVVRKFYLKTWEAEDWLVLLSWILTTTAGSVLFAAVQNGAGHHQADLDLDQIHLILHLQNTTTIVYALAAFSVKASVLTVYIKIFVPKRESKTRWLFVVLIAANAVFYTISMFMKMFECYPREKIWKPEIDGRCVIQLSTLLTISGIWNTVSDLLILSLPAIFISRLRLDPRRKWQIIGIFTLGAVLYPVFSIVGVVIRITLAKDRTDATSWQPPILLFAQAELGAGIVCACLPSVGFVIRQLRSRKLRYTDLDRHQPRRGSSGRVIGATKFGLFGHATAIVGAGPDTQHLDHVLDKIDLEAKAHGRAEKLAKAGAWNVTRIASGRGSGGQAGRVVPDGMPAIIEITHGGEGRDGGVDDGQGNDGIWKTTEVTVRYDDISEETTVISDGEQQQQQHHHATDRAAEQRTRSPN